MSRLLRSAALLAALMYVFIRVPGVDSAGVKLLHQSDAPPGFGKLHTKVYTHWVRKMKVATNTQGMGKGRSSCDVLKPFKALGWTQGMIQAFDSPGFLNNFQLCDDVFSAVTGAKKAYALTKAELLTQSATVKDLKPIPGATIGDESAGVYGEKNGFVTAELLFRHGTVWVSIIYIGTSGFSGADFLKTAQRADSRIQ